MPRQQPTQSYQQLRNYTEKFQWQDPKTKLPTTGYNPPEGVEATQVPYYVKYVTKKGVLECGNVVTLKINRRKHQRMVMFTESKEIRWICDALIIEVDGTRFITH